MNFDFTHQLLLGARFRQGRLGNQLARKQLLGFRIRQFIAFGKATLAEEFAFDVLAFRYFTFAHFDFLNNDIWLLLILVSHIVHLVHLFCLL